MSATFIFPLGAILITVISYFYPQLLSPHSNLIVPLLGVVMLGMGLTLRFENFIEICKRPKVISVGVLLQFILMPMIAFLVSVILDLEESLLIGMVLVGSCPGGTASNVICYLSRGDVALSIILTTVSTLLAVIFTPLLAWLYIGQRVPVPVMEMMLSILKIILVPVVTGLLINHYFGDKLHAVKKIFPFISVLAIILIIGIIMAITQPQLHMIAIPVLAGVVWHNLTGLFAGFYVSKLLGFDEKTCRTIAIEVGMQNSGLGVALANKYFSVLAALPGAIFSIWHNISGSIFAGYWTRKMELSKP
ncbi:MAG: bile acid:sodium symporter family protein [Gammaproteobacteria bacterium]|jgi:BASS family bile acid:Na+ symporter